MPSGFLAQFRKALSLEYDPWMRQLSNGSYDLLVTKAVRDAINLLPQHVAADIVKLSAAELVEYLSRDVLKRVRIALRGTLEKSGQEVLTHGNVILNFVSSDDEAESAVLSAIRPVTQTTTPTPLVPLSQSSLITNDQGVNYYRMLRSEIQTADRVDLICPFIGNQGVTLLIDLLQELGDRLRVITTTYLGGTNARALARLAARGANVKIVFEREDQKTALHAKAWIFHRDTGFTTATLGSSNLSSKALIDGLEWNVRIGSSDSPQVLKELIVTFERLWADEIYVPFDPEKDFEYVAKQLRQNRRGELESPNFFIDAEPRPHQREALDQLRLSRLDGRHRNLVVAATGTGKTLLSAFDYERVSRELKGRPSLLFIAHRQDILQQAISAYRMVMRDQDFGQLHVGSHRADTWKHVFASVQADAFNRLEQFSPTEFDFVVIDEFHHAEAATYRRLFEYFQPKEFLGLTATPERSDGVQVVIDRIWPPTYELRLWHALDRRLLCPFHYFGIEDGTDLSALSWENGKYDSKELQRLYVEKGGQRAGLVIRELFEKTDTENLRAIAFCVSKDHADFMALQFKQAGLASRALHSGLGDDERRSAVREFRNGDFSIVCTVDLFNEGVDIPEVNTVIFLRPTESATVFIQQLGRGLRNHASKGALTVLDFVGQQNQKFRMDLRFRSMTGLTRTDLEKAIKTGFPSLPPGCDIRLDRVTRERVLKNLKEAIPSDIRDMAAEARRLSLNSAPLTVKRFLDETGLEPDDLYRSNRSFVKVLSVAGLRSGELPTGHYKVGAITHVDDRARIDAYRDLVREHSTRNVYAPMASHLLTNSPEIKQLDPEIRNETIQLLDYLWDKCNTLDPLKGTPFAIHAHYTRDEIVAPYRRNTNSMRQGVFFVSEVGLDVKLVTLRKSERNFSPTTRYQDYFEAPNVLHWESQSPTTIKSATGQRLINGTGHHLFFVRENEGDPFLCAGFAFPFWYESEKPIRMRWRLEHAIPDHIYVRFAAAAG